MIGPDIMFRHLIAFIVPLAFAFFVFLASRATHFFWARFSGVVLALLTFYFTMMIMNRLLFLRGTPEDEPGEDADAERPERAGPK